MIDSSKFDVVFAGGGPVGLWTAVQTKLLNPSLNIVVLDKYSRYQRIHNLFIDPQSLRTSCEDPRLQRIIADFKSHRTVSTLEIETKLSQLAEQVGIVFRKGVNIQNPEEDLKEFSSAKFIVGADGAHSVIRKFVSNDREMISDKTLHYIADFTFTDKKPPLSMLETAGLSCLAGNVIYEIHNPKKQQTTLRTFISEDVYESMKDATRKNPKRLGDADLDPGLKNEYMTFLNHKYRDQVNTVLDLEEAMITTTRLGIYKSATFTREEDNRKWCLVGDAAFGVPFFRSLNNGFMCGTELASTISETTMPPQNKTPFTFVEKSFMKMMKIGAKNRSLQSYEAFVEKLAFKQITLAKLKSGAVNSMIKSAQTVQPLKVSVHETLNDHPLLSLPLSNHTFSLIKAR